MPLLNLRSSLLPALLIALVSLLPSAHAVSFFVEGTFAGDTRYNVKKLFDGSDDNLCWAASASNILNLWQSRNSAYLPEGVPHGQTQGSYSTDIFYTFANSFWDGAGFEEDGVSWWINGTFQRSSYNMYDPPLSNGGYYADWGWDSADIVKEIEVNGSREDLSAILAGAIQSNYLLTAGIYGGQYGTSAHAVSLWGYEADDITGELIGLWISDSDRSDIGNVLVDAYWNDGLERWDLSGSYTNWYIDDITVFTAPTIPEPLFSTFALGVAALLFLSWRRRRVKFTVPST